MTAGPLPALYLISPTLGPDIEGFLEQARQSLEAGIRLWRLRPGPLAPARLDRLVTDCLALSREYGARLLVGTDAWGGAHAEALGLHLDRHALRRLDRRPAGCQILAASCHDEDELAIAARLGADFIVCSPVRATPSHAGAEPLGWAGFERLATVAPMPVYALGGMAHDDLTEVRRLGGHGIAAIRALWGETGP